MGGLKTKRVKRDGIIEGENIYKIRNETLGVFDTKFYSCYNGCTFMRHCGEPVGKVPFVWGLTTDSAGGAGYFSLK